MGEAKRYSGVVGGVLAGAIEGRADITVLESSVSFQSRSGSYVLPFWQISHIETRDFDVVIHTADDMGLVGHIGVGANACAKAAIVISKLGTDTDEFFHRLHDNRSKHIARAFFICGDPILATEGSYRYDDCGDVAEGRAYFHLYPTCLCIFPTNAAPKRIPLAFLTGCELQDFVFSFHVGAREEYQVIRIGLDTEPLQYQLGRCLATLRDEAALQVRAIAPACTQDEVSALATLIPCGVLADCRELALAASGFVEGVEGIVAASIARETYPVLKDLAEKAAPAMGVGMAFGLRQQDGADVVWIAAPIKGAGGQRIVIEVAAPEGTPVATYVFAAGGDVTQTFYLLNRALEAVGFRRDVIYLTDDELAANELYLTTLACTPALRFLREHLIVRIPHTSLDSWSEKLLGL